LNGRKTNHGVEVRSDMRWNRKSHQKREEENKTKRNRTVWTSKKRERSDAKTKGKERVHSD